MAEYRRFIPIGDKKEMDRLNRVIVEKNLSKNDLIIILKAIKLNPDMALNPDIWK